jgi:hypothetical protein
MTEAYNAGRAAGIRDAVKVARECIYHDSAGTGFEENRFDDTILALLDSPAPAGVMIKPLVWGYHPEGAIAAPPTGHAYIIDTRMKGRVYSIKGFNPAREFESKDEAKAAAQADYEARIMAALEPAPAGVTVEDMPPLTDDEKTRLRSFALEMDVRSAAKLLVSDFDALLRIAGLIAQEQNRGASATNALRAALRALSGDRA